VSATLYTFIDFVAAHQNWAYALVFLIAFSESLPVIGAVIPGSTAIIAISALVPSGAVEVAPLLLAAMAGAIAGDGFAFWLGYRYREQVLGLWPFRRHPEFIGKGTAFFDRHGAKSVLLARFTPPVRPFVPLVAGIVHMPMLRFYLANALSALAWAPAHVFPGILLGASLALAGAVAGRLAVLLVLLVGTLWSTMLLVRLGLRRGLPRIDAGLSRLWRWGISHDNGFSRLLRAYLDPAQPEFKTLLLLTGVLVVAAILFAGVLEDVVTASPSVAMDVAVYHFFQGLRTSWGDRILVAVTELGDAAVTMPLSAAVLLWLAWRRAWHATAYWLGAIALAVAFTLAFKLVLQVPRPADLYAGVSEFSFPSGHTIVSATVYGFLALLVAREVSLRWRAMLAGGTALLVTAIALSRLYLGAHWLSDVAGGIAFALAWVALLGIAYLRHRPPQLGARALLGVAGLTLSLAGTYHIHQTYPADVQRYAVQQTIRIVDAADWSASAWQSLPARRLDLEGEAEEPLTLQWAGRLEDLQARLQATGWSNEPVWSLQGLLLWLAPGADPALLPVLPRLHDGRAPALVMVRMDPAGGARQERLVLRLWATDVAVRDGTAVLRPLWVGAVVQQRLRRPLGLVTMAAADTDADRPRDLLATALEGAKRVQRQAPAPGRGWDGQVILAPDRDPAEPPAGQGARTSSNGEHT
jgi:undecaprenyl-diphosphatase